jgi:hypothetical protein
MRITPKQAESLAREIRNSPGRAVEIDPGNVMGLVAVFDGKQRIAIGGRGKVTRG